MKIDSAAGPCLLKAMRETFPAMNKKEERADQDMILDVASSAPYLHLSLSWCYKTVQMEVIKGMIFIFIFKFSLGFSANHL